MIFPELKNSCHNPAASLELKNSCHNPVASPETENGRHDSMDSHFMNCIRADRHRAAEMLPQSGALPSVSCGITFLRVQQQPPDDR
jgi:hypothetical protein